MELRIKDRLVIPGLLPKEGNFQHYNLKKSILAKIEITAQVREELNLRQNEETNRVEWDVEKDIPIEPEFTNEEMEYLKTACEKLADEVLADDMWSTIEKIYDAIQSAPER